MSELNQFEVKAADWRAQIARNERRTRFVIIMFVLIYLALGIIIDLLINHGLYSQFPISVIAEALLTFQLIPYATLTMVGVAIIALFVTFKFYDKIMLLGTEYKEISGDKQDSLEEQQLYNVVEEMKVAAGLQFMPKVFVIEANYMNAFASGYSEKSAMVAITRGLLQKLNRSEMQAVMAHELSHVRHHDIKLTLTASVLSSIMLIAVDVLFYNLLFSGGRRKSEGGGQLVLIIIVLRYVLPLITMLLMLYLSRTREYMADAGCVELMRDNQPLASALLKINQDHQLNQDAYAAEYGQTAHEDVRRAAYLYDPSNANISSTKSLLSMFSSHPDLESRLKAIGINRK